MKEMSSKRRAVLYTHAAVQCTYMHIYMLRKWPISENITCAATTSFGGQLNGNKR